MNVVNKLVVRSEKEMIALMIKGTKSRQVRKTNMNPKSSRSHAILRIYFANMQRRSVTSESTINLVDLGGSEGVRQTNNTGDALQEANYINKDLLYISRIVDAMSVKGEKVIPYRESTLTMILKGSCYKAFPSHLTFIRAFITFYLIFTRLIEHTFLRNYVSLC